MNAVLTEIAGTAKGGEAPATTDLRQRADQLDREAKASNLAAIRLYVEARADGRQLSDKQLSAAVDAAARRRFSLDMLDKFADVLAWDKLQGNLVDGFEERQAELTKEGSELGARKKELDAELVKVRKRLDWIATVRQSNVAAMQQGNSLRAQNPLLFSSDVDAALAPREAMTIDAVNSADGFRR